MKSRELDVDKLAEHFLHHCQTLPPIKVAVVYPCSQDSLDGVVEAAKLGFIVPILVGPKTEIQRLAKELEININDFELVNVADSSVAAARAVALVQAGKVDALMKGSLHTDELMHEVIKKEGGLRTKRRISHAFVIAIEEYHKPFIVTDAAINIVPDLMTKRDIIQNAVDLFHTFNRRVTPNVAILSAVETINPVMTSTIDAACLAKMSERGQITGAIVDGPFAYDNVFSLQAAQTKNIKSPVIGEVDVFVVPNLEAGNILAKQLVLLANGISAGAILGASVPIILTSRADGVRSRIASCAIATLMVRSKKTMKEHNGYYSL